MPLPANSCVALDNLLNCSELLCAYKIWGTILKKIFRKMTSFGEDVGKVELSYICW